MEESSPQQPTGAEHDETQVVQQATSPKQSKLSKLKKPFKLTPTVKKVLRWTEAGVLVLAVAGLVTGCVLLYRSNTSLNQQNKSLSSTLEGYKQENAKPDKLTDTALEPVAPDTVTEPDSASTTSSTYGGTAVQVNADDPSSATPKYVGGEYAPYWLLNNFALTIPDGLKMVRTTDVNTDGHLLTVDNEGEAGCGGEGIFMTVSTTLTVPNAAFKADGSSASYPRGLGCGGADPVSVAYAKYYPMAKASQYKYMELVTVDCVVGDDYVCNGKVDQTKWRLYSGLVLADAAEYKVGDSIQGSGVAKQLYSRDTDGADFYIDCGGDKGINFYCGASDYKNADYNVALQDSAYTQLKAIVIGMHTH